MKMIIAAICALCLLTTGLSAATPYRAVSLSGVGYFFTSGEALHSRILNNASMIEAFGPAGPSEVHLYDVALNEMTGEIDIIKKTGSNTASVVRTLLLGTGILASSQSTNGLEKEVTASIEFANNSTNIGTALSRIKYDVAGNISSDTIVFICAGGVEGVRGTVITRAKEYSVP
jgi:hypothetical protein